MSVVRRHPLPTFFVLAYLLTWAFLPLGAFVAAGPLVAALIVTPITHGTAGLEDLGGRMIRWRVGWQWYLVALGFPLAAHPLTVLAIRLINPLDGPMGGEPGWRGVAQPRLQADRPPLNATALLAVLVADWHLPLVLLPSSISAPSIF